MKKNDNMPVTALEHKVDILLSTYNGERYVADQVESVLNQTCKEVRLIVRDDGSTDQTISILKELQKRDARVHLLDVDGENLGPAKSFMELIKYSLAPFIMFCDQDDIWNKNKVEVSLMAIHRLNLSRPCLVHSDLEVVNRQLGLISKSFMAYQNIHHEKENSLNVLLTQNFVTGCTVMVNRPLLEAALPMPKEALMHDWWLALCAAVFGHIGYIDKSLIQYRQHGSNEVGAKRIKNFLNPFRTNWWRHWYKGRKHLLQSMEQASLLAERIKEHDPSNENLKLIESYALLTTLPWWRRSRQLKKNNVHCQSLVRHYLMLSRLLSLSRRIDE